MRLKSIEVPEYVADQFNNPFGYPSKKPNAVELSLEWLYRLINEALKDIDWPDWEVAGRKYHSSKALEPYGFERVGSLFYIYAEERGSRSPIAIFHSSHLAAKYFVWLVSKDSEQGEKKINWDLFPEMKP